MVFLPVNKVCQDPFTSSTDQQVSSTFVKELNILLEMFCISSSNASGEFSVRGYCSTFVYLPAFWIMLFIKRLKLGFLASPVRILSGILDTIVTWTQNSLWKFVINEVHYYSSIIFVTFVVCRSTILRRYLHFTTTPTSPLLRTRRSVCFREYSRCSRAHLQAREGHVRRWLN